MSVNFFENTLFHFGFQIFIFSFVISQRFKNGSESSQKYRQKKLNRCDFTMFGNIAKIMAAHKMLSSSAMYESTALPLRTKLRTISASLAL